MRQIWHPWTEWECYRAGMFDGEISMSADEAKELYAAFLRDLGRFKKAMQRVISEWPKSCEHFLTNKSVNRIAWLGQAAMCIDTGVPCSYRSGFNMMTNDERDAANKAALDVLNKWIRDHERQNREVQKDMDGPWLF